MLRVIIACGALFVCACGPSTVDDSGAVGTSSSKCEGEADASCESGGSDTVRCCGTIGASAAATLPSHTGNVIAQDAGPADPNAPTGPDGSRCRPDNAPPLALPTVDTPCYGGPTVRRMLSLFNSSYVSRFIPQGPPQGTSWSGSTTPSGLTMSFGTAPISMECLPGLSTGCETPGACGPCAVGPVVLRVTLPLHFVTADGAFDESLTATVRYIGYPGYPSITWAASQPATAFHGTYPPMFGTGETFGYGGSLATLNEGLVREATGEVSGGGGWWGQ
jgi:hypothetical protein